MPTKTSQYFNFTFRPTLSEFSKYNEEFITKFEKKFKCDKYLISYEKGNSDVINHLQGFIELRKEKRADSFRKTFNSLIKGYDISYPKVALKITPVIRDVSICQGYILKELQADEVSGEFPSLINKGYSIEYLLKVDSDYKKLTITKKVIVDKIRVNSRNFYVIFKNYVENNKEKIKKYGYDTKKTKDIEFIVRRMVQDGYYCFDLLLNPKRFTNICMNVGLIHNDDIGDGKKRII